jgi:sugar O-acyltransferase (sialic acid O-acetyltransferase NeuD family)
MKKVILLGGGGHAKCVIDAMRLLRILEPAGVLDLASRKGDTVLGVKITGSDADLPALYKRGLRLAFVALGSTGDPARRIALWELAEKAGFKFPSVIHPSAMVSDHARLGQGTYIGPGAIVNAGAAIGDGCIVNSGAIVEHDCRLGNFVHVAPGVVLSAGVTVGDRSHIGTGTCTAHYLTIGEDTVVGAGSVVVKDLPAKAVCLGSPAKKIKCR